MSRLFSSSEHQSTSCPGLFYGVTAADGLLLRVRISGGQLNRVQAGALADLATHLGIPILHLTNRANIQLRGVKNAPDDEVLHQLQALKLAAPKPALDALRNIMISPLAGLDQAEFILLSY